MGAAWALPLSPGQSNHSQRRTGRVEVLPVRDKPSNRRMKNGQRQLPLANRDRGSQGRMTPDRRRGIIYGGISSSFLDANGGIIAIA
jgi:hypothetical protein